MWKYEQKTGRLYNSNGTLVYTGWAGQGAGKNNPAMQNVKGIGPLPVGLYTFQAPHTSPHTGPYTLNLVPDASNQMFGRGDFRCHGASSTHPELSSEGCIIMPRFIRELIWNSKDYRLSVVSGV